MAESIVSGMATKLSEMITEELIFLYGVSEDVDWMKRELGWIESLLKDADAAGKRDERMKKYVSEVTELGYRAEAAVDNFIIKVNHQSEGCPGCINNFKPKAWIARHHVGVEISEIRKLLNEIRDAKEKYGIQNVVIDRDGDGDGDGDGDASHLISLRIKKRHLSPQYSADADIVGLVNNQKILLERLLMNHQQQQGSCVISIVGIGGLGKTTLARKLYRNNDVSKHFDKCIWLTVSQENSLMGLLRKLAGQVVIEEEMLKKLNDMSEDNLKGKINDSLRTQRFLMVLDDIWQEEVCIQMQEFFRNVNNGSRFLITTRFVDVARRADPRSTPYQLQLLNDDESMKLLLKKAFLYEEDAEANCSSALLDIGHRLMRKCGGLPLALVVLGGYLSKKDKTPVAWRRVLETMDWDSEGRACQEILALSYEDLPHHIKSCFLYLSAYPEDYEIPGKDLIRKWTAEGFIPQEGRKTMDDMAEAILEELNQRSLIHVKTRKSNGSVKTCGVHDLLLDFAKSIAMKANFLTVCGTRNDQPTSLTQSHRVAAHNIDDTLTYEGNIGYDRLRTLVVFIPHNFHEFSPHTVHTMSRFKFLRVLDLIGKYYQGSIAKITHLTHLRFLRILLFAFQRIPTSIRKLQFLETIDFVGTDILETLYFGELEVPSTFWKIKALRHVRLYRCKPPQSLELRNLLKLQTVTFGSYTTINWRFPNLRKLRVVIDEEHHGAILTHLLSELGHLINLFIIAKEDCPIKINTNGFPFHNQLLSLHLWGHWPVGDTISEFPTSLTKLELYNCKLKQDPMPKLEMLQWLVKLKFIGNVYLGETMVCSTGGFPSLERFMMNMNLWGEDALPKLEEWRVERGAMPKLTLLHISCRKLKMFPDLQHVMSLQELVLFKIPYELNLRLEKDTGEDWYKIQHVPKLIFSSWGM